MKYFLNLFHVRYNLNRPQGVLEMKSLPHWTDNRQYNYLCNNTSNAKKMSKYFLAGNNNFLKTQHYF